MIRRLLIANRGEIAVRIARACREMGVESVAVYSSVDEAAPHVLAADRAEPIGPAPAVDSYLSIGRILDAARRVGADAIHPGYGFLAQNPAFADACAGAGLAFVGPPADVMARIGAKIPARRLMASAGVPLVPGEEPANQSDDGVRSAVEHVGLPALIKASAGGGGKGMRVVRHQVDLEAAIQSARHEAQAAFADGTLYVERLLERPRHVEIQVFADHHGQVVHLFDRECSIQRRHQKIIEESPSTAISDDIRARMCETAVAAARAADYRNAGTVEFLVEGRGPQARFYFLEMNTRLQVEHPVTEMVTGVDLVRAQILVAADAPLPWQQTALTQRGHAIECRLYGEEPARGFLPAAGRLLRYREPGGPGIRVDSGITENTNVPVFYDPLLAKLVAHGETRAMAIQRGLAALREFVVLGIPTNLTFLKRTLEHPRFQRGDIDTGFVESEPLLVADETGSALALALAGVAAHVSRGARRVAGPLHQGSPTSLDPWSTLRNWRG